MRSIGGGLCLLVGECYLYKYMDGLSDEFLKGGLLTDAFELT